MYSQNGKCSEEGAIKRGLDGACHTGFLKLGEDVGYVGVRIPR